MVMELNKTKKRVEELEATNQRLALDLEKEKAEEKKENEKVKEPIGNRIEIDSDDEPEVVVEQVLPPVEQVLPVKPVVRSKIQPEIIVDVNVP
jgi:hypothetical protein